jgi:transcriptional regulator
VARSNPQWSTAAAGVPALAIVHGPQAYISPSWYESTKEHGRTVPTWNYTTVHFTGPVTFRRDEDWLRDVVTRLTERYEAGRERRWWVSDAPEQFIVGQLRAIVGVELLVERIEAKNKLSQNRPQQDRANVITALRAERGDGDRAIAELMAGRETAAD